MAVAKPVTLGNVVGGHATQLRWSPCGGFLLAATATSTLRVWDTVHWCCRCVDLLDGGCAVDLAWSPRGDAAVAAMAGSGNVACVTVRRPTIDVDLAVRLLPATIPCADDLLCELESLDTCVAMRAQELR